MGGTRPMEGTDVYMMVGYSMTDPDDPRACDVS